MQPDPTANTASQDPSIDDILSQAKTFIGSQKQNAPAQSDANVPYPITVPSSGQPQPSDDIDAILKNAQSYVASQKSVPTDIDSLAKSVQQAEANVNQNPSDENTKALQSAYENYYKNTNVGQRAAYNLMPDQNTLGNIAQGGKNLVGSALSTVGQAAEGLVTNPLDTLQGIQRGAVTGMGKLASFAVQAYSAAKQQVYAQAGEPSDIPAAAKMAAERTADTAKLNQALESYKKYGAGMDTREIGEGGMAAANIAENVVPFVATPESILSKGGAELSEADRAIAAQKALTAANQPSNLGAKIGKFVGGIKGGYQGKLIGETGGSIVDRMFESETPTIKFKTPADVQNAIEAEKIGVEAYSGDVERLTNELAADPENNDLKKQLYQATLQRNNAASRLNTANEAMGAIQKGVEKAQPSVLGQTAKDALRTGGIFAANAEAQQAPGTSVGGAFGQGATLGGLTTLGVSGGQNIANTVQGFKQGISEEPTPAPTPATPQESTIGTPEAKAGTEAPETATPAPVATPTPTQPVKQRAGTGSIVGPGRVRARLSNPVEEDTLGTSHENEKMASDVLLTGNSPVKNSVEVNSGKIDRIGYDPNSKLMYVKLKQPTADGFSQYLYHNVTPQEHAEFLSSKSAGKYFDDNVKYKFETSAVDPYHTYQDLLNDASRRGPNPPPAAPTTPTPQPTAPAPQASQAPEAPVAQPAPEAPAPFMGSVLGMPPTESRLAPRPSVGEGYATAEQLKQQSLALQEAEKAAQSERAKEEEQIEAKRQTPEYQQMQKYAQAVDKLVKRQKGNKFTGEVPSQQEISEVTKGGGKVPLNKVLEAFTKAKSRGKKVSLAASQPHEGPEENPLGTSSP